LTDLFSVTSCGQESLFSDRWVFGVHSKTVGWAIGGRQ